MNQLPPNGRFPATTQPAVRRRELLTRPRHELIRMYYETTRGTRNVVRVGQPSSWTNEELADRVLARELESAQEDPGLW